MRYFVYSLIISAALVSAPFLIARAQSDALQSAAADVSVSVGKLSEIKDASTTASTSPEYLAAQKGVLANIFSLSLAEIKDLKKKVSIAKSDLEPELAVARNDFLSTLDDFTKHIEAVQKDATAASSTEAIQIIAADFKSWRADFYNPTIDNLFNLTFLFQDRSVLKIADNRFERVASDVSRLDSIFGTRARRLKAYFALAATDLKQARGYYDQARDLFLDLLQAQPATSSASSSPDLVGIEGASGTVSTTPITVSTTTASSSLIISLESASTTGSSTPETIVLVPVTVQSLLKQSLDSAADAYRIFIEMSKLAKKLLASPANS